MKITRRRLRRIIRESISQEEARKIEQLYWNGEESGYPNRDQALMLIDTLGLDPESLKIWSVVLPWGEIYEPWQYGSNSHTFSIGGWIANSDEPGFTVDEVNRIVDMFNSQNNIKLTATRSRTIGHMDLDTDSVLDEDLMYDIADGVEIAANGVMNP